LPTCFLDHFELPVVDTVADVSVDSCCVDFVTVDLATSELLCHGRRGYDINFSGGSVCECSGAEVPADWVFDGRAA